MSDDWQLVYREPVFPTRRQLLLSWIGGWRTEIRTQRFQERFGIPEHDAEVALVVCQPVRTATLGSALV